MSGWRVGATGDGPSLSEGGASSVAAPATPGRDLLGDILVGVVSGVAVAVVTSLLWQRSRRGGP